MDIRDPIVQTTNRVPRFDVIDQRKLRLLILFALLPLAGCGERGTSSENRTTTMAPATPPAASGTESDPALTQTIEIGEERSPNEGGILTDPKQPKQDEPYAGENTATTDPSTTRVATPPE